MDIDWDSIDPTETEVLPTGLTTIDCPPVESTEIEVEPDPPTIISAGLDKQSDISSFYSL